MVTCRYFDRQSHEVVFSVLQALFYGHPKDGVASSDLNKVIFSMDRPLNADLKTVCKGDLDYGCREGGAGLTVDSCSGLSGAPADASAAFSVIMICRATFQFANVSPWNSVGTQSFRCSVFENGKNYAHRVGEGYPGMNVLGSTVFHGKKPGSGQSFCNSLSSDISGRVMFWKLAPGASNVGALTGVGTSAVSFIVSKHSF